MKNNIHKNILDAEKKFDSIIIYLYFPQFFREISPLWYFTTSHVVEVVDVCQITTKTKKNLQFYLFAGDEILAVNGLALQGMSHAEAISVFKNIRSGKVLLHAARRDATMRRYLWINNTQWAKMRKKVYFGRTMHCLGKAKINIFWIFFSSSHVPFGDPLLEKFSKNVDFSLWGKQCIVLPKIDFFPRFSSLCNNHI